MWEASAGAQAWCPRCRFGRTLNFRGDMVATEIHLQATVHNMLKAIRARPANPGPPGRSPRWQPHNRRPGRRAGTAKSQQPAATPPRPAEPGSQAAQVSPA
jgi:hypothetical protein